jgi:hypothetical protein
MTDIVKFLSNEIVLANSTVAAANTVSNANIVRVINTDASASALIIIKDSTGTTKGTFALGHITTDFSEEYIIKLPTDTIQANNILNTGAYNGAGVKAVSVAYR